MDVNDELNFLGKFTKKIGGGGGVGRWGGGGGLVGGQGVCERRIEVFVNTKKKNLGGGRVGGGQGGCERRIEVFWKIHKKKIRGGGSGGGVRWGGSGWWGGVRVDVNAMLGVGMMWGMGDVNQE